MIYYFSGTGNSKFVAEQLAKYTKDTALFIPQVAKSLNQDITVGADDVIGLVFPIYAWMPPQIVVDFLAHVHVDHKAFAYVVCTCGEETGMALRELQKIYPFKSAYSIKMPDNFIPMFDLDTPELTKEKINIAIQRLPKIALEISARSEQFEVEEGSLASLKSKVVNPFFAAFAMSPSKFSVDDSCIGCGECVRNCPCDTIKLVDNKPVWSGFCQMCMSCIMRCPKEAIQCGNRTRHCGRYVFPDPNVKSAQTKPLSQTEQLAGIVSHKQAESVFAAKASATANASVTPTGAAASSEASSTARTPVSSVRAAASAARTGAERQVWMNGMEFIPAESNGFASKLGAAVKQISSASNNTMSVQEIHVQPGALIPYHPGDAAVIWYALSGSCKILLSGADEKQFSAGDIVRFSGSSVHGIKNDSMIEFVYIAIEEK